jgi:hypothetical protein
MASIFQTTRTQTRQSIPFKPTRTPKAFVSHMRTQTAKRNHTAKRGRSLFSKRPLRKRPPLSQTIVFNLLFAESKRQVAVVVAPAW